MFFKEFENSPRYLQKKTIENAILREYEKLEKGSSYNTQGFLSSLISKGHSEKLHIAQKEDDLLSRVMLECKPCSSFNDQNELKWNILKNIEEYLDEIVEWLSPPSSFNQKPNYEKQFVLECPALAFKSDDTITCLGIDTNLNVRETEDSYLVLERNRVDFADIETNFFFYVKTIYPDIQSEYSTPTNRNLIDKAKNFLDNGIYQNGERVQLPEIQKAFWTLKILGFQPRTNNVITEKPLAFVPFEINNTKFSVILSENSKFSSTPAVSVATGVKENGLPAYTPLNRAHSINAEVKEVAFSFSKAILDVYEKVIADKKIDDIINGSSFNIYTKHSEYPVDYSSPHLSDINSIKDASISIPKNDFAFR
jgi:hypothetical protein